MCPVISVTTNPSVEYTYSPGTPDLAILGKNNITRTTMTSSGLGDVDNFPTFPDTVRIRNRAESPDAAYILISWKHWTAQGWSNPVDDFNSWKSEITLWLAGSFKLAAATLPIAAYPDWTLQIYYFESFYVPGAPAAITCIFYPGDDPRADEIITEVV